MLIRLAPPMATLEVAGGPKHMPIEKLLRGAWLVAPISLVPHAIEMHKNRENFASKFEVN